MARPRTGSVYFNGSTKRWTGAISLGGGKRQYITAPTEPQVRAKLATMSIYPPRNDKVRRPTRRSLVMALSEKVLERAEALGWDRAMTARVLSTSLTQKRVQYQIVGPCHYCGSEFADTVDHVVPYTQGGQDTPDNLVSACWSCNSTKGARPASVMLRMQV